jgi:tRNA threonylcarbamoyladenosine biosynthesis protein TsaB
MPPMPNVFLVAMETSGPVGSVAALIDGDLAAEDHFERGMRHGRDLVPRLAALCRQLGRPPASISVIAVSRGPGSYTGLRVGATCAKTLAFATGAALVPVDTLEVLAQNAPPDADRIGVVTDASRGQLYAAAFQRQGSTIVRLGPDVLLDPHLQSAGFSLRSFLLPGMLVLGDALARYGDVLAEASRAIPGLRLAPAEQSSAEARHVALLGWRSFQAGAIVPAHDFVPLYLRRPEAIDRLLTRQSGR